MKRKILFLLLIWMLLSVNLFAENKQEPLYKAFNEQFKKDYLSVGMLMQFVFDHQQDRIFPGNNGFSVANMRFKLNGHLDKGFGYVFQAKLDKSPAILDAYMSHKIHHLLKLTIGQKKAPVSAEYQISAAGIDFVNRSRVVTKLTPGRQIGLQLSGESRNEKLRYIVGLSNGNGTSASNDDNDYMISGRIELQSVNKTKDVRFIFGMNGAYSEDGNVTLLDGNMPNFEGKRSITGADFRLNYKDWLLAAEYLMARLEHQAGPTWEPSGYYFTAGYMIKENVQALIRLDTYDPDGSGGIPSNSWIVTGLNFWPTSVSELQVNYIIDTDNSDIKNHQILINVQIAL